MLAYLVNPDDVSEEGEELDLHGHEINVELFVEAGSLAGLLRGLQDDGVHCEGDEVCHCRVHRLLV